MHLTGLLSIFSIVLSIAGSPLHNGKPIAKIAGPARPQTHVLSLNRKLNLPSQRSRYLEAVQEGAPVNTTFGTSVLNGLGQILYTTNITFGSQTFEAIVDTGSSDTWAVQRGFQCVTGRPPSEITVPEAQCGFGPPITSSTTFKPIPGQNLKARYADGAELTGIVGTESVTLAGITVKNQVVGIMNHAYWSGDNSSSGLIGLAFPNLTSAHRGNDPRVDTESDAAPYAPLFTSMYTQGLVAPIFSIAINRVGEETGGLLALGGLPPVNHSSVFACTPLKMTATRRPGSGVGGTTIDAPQYKFYLITVDGLESGTTSFNLSNTFHQPLDNVPYEMSVDSGSTLIHLPEKTADAINDLFVPPAIHNYRTGQYDVDCAAKAPNLGVKIAGQTFHINPEDLIINRDRGPCFSGITATYSDRGVLGDVFLKNVVAVFDIGHLEMRFAAREFY
ncbi:MAG: hypothetical protein Q9172_002195 [Xanthocarpia lactea]